MSNFYEWVAKEGLIGEEYIAAESAWDYQQKRIDGLEAENKEIQHDLDCMVASTWELQEDRNFLKQDCDRLRKELDEAKGVIR